MERSLGKCNIAVTDLWAKGRAALELMDELELPDPPPEAPEEKPGVPEAAKKQKISRDGTDADDVGAAAEAARPTDEQMLDAMEDALTEKPEGAALEPGGKTATATPKGMSAAEQARLEREALAVLKSEPAAGGGQGVKRKGVDAADPSSSSGSGLATRLGQTSVADLLGASGQEPSTKGKAKGKAKSEPKPKKSRK